MTEAGSGTKGKERREGGLSLCIFINWNSEWWGSKLGANFYHCLMHDRYSGSVFSFAELLCRSHVGRHRVY